jgi:hypothetical protein
MPDEIPVFVNERAVTVPVGATAREAIAAFDPGLAARGEGGAGRVTDGRGLPVALDAPLEAGAILRVAGSARRPAAADAPG